MLECQIKDLLSSNRLVPILHLDWVHCKSGLCLLLSFLFIQLFQSLEVSVRANMTDLYLTLIYFLKQILRSGLYFFGKIKIAGPDLLKMLKL